MRQFFKKRLKKFSKSRGATAVEFAMIATPFFFTIFALIEVMVVFFLQTALEASVAEVSRLVRTGQAQSTAMTQTAYKNAICARLGGMANCSTRLFVTLEAYATPPSSASANPWDDGTLTPGSSSDEPFQSSNAEDFVVARAYYVWPLMTPGLSSALSNFSGGTFGAKNRILVATAAFRNEPFD